MNESNITYSVLPALNKFITPSEEEGESILQLLNKGLMRAQMNISRLIMYEEPCPRVSLAHDTMNIIADVYDIFESIDEERKKYDKLTAELSDES